MAYDFFKRFIDIVGSSAGLVLFSPVILLTAIAIRLDSKGPILADVPERVGKNGELFKMYKFRSMIVNAHQLLRTDPKFREFFNQYKRNSYKLNDDPRVTRVGRFIRRTSIDEFPQLLNVLRGEMSLVGPRAYYTDELLEQQKKYPNTKGYVSTLLKVKPGLTGPWQVSGRSAINFDKRVRLDAGYADKRSLLYDFWIMVRTIPALLSGRGAV